MRQWYQYHESSLPARTQGKLCMSAQNTDELLRQFHHNQSVWVARLSTGLVDPPRSDRNMLHVGDTLAMRPGAAGVIMLPMSDETSTILADHDRALAWLRQHRSRDVLVWSMQPNPEIDLAMLAQGYHPGFEPWWMTRDLTSPIETPRHHVRPVTALDIKQLIESDVPYVVRDQVAANTSLIHAPGDPHVIWLVAVVDSKPVGHAIVNLTDDHAGLFNVGVSNEYRHRGIGTSLTLASLRAARDQGARTMNLNSTPIGLKLYEHTGFRQFGVGQTWVRSGRQVQTTPDPQEQRLVHAIGTGDIAAIVVRSSTKRVLTCGLSLQELAARFGQPAALQEIIRQGRTPEIISLWKAGLRDEAIRAANDPVAREWLSGSNRAHPIHHAIEMGAGTLVIELIAAGANLNARDAGYNATPLDWAHACNKPTIARIIRQAGGK